ncbi:hypothetical protein ACFYUV_31010 [Nonomuraea sp. NPDC003560]
MTAYRQEGWTNRAKSAWDATGADPEPVHETPGDLMDDVLGNLPQNV